jgi:hypothetical protein
VATLVVVGVAFAVAGSRTPDSTATPTPSLTPTATASGEPAPTGPVRGEDLIIRDGMTVEASGMVVARAGQPVLFCAPAMELAYQSPADAEGPRCSLGVTVVGVDLDALTNPQATSTTRSGRARLRGTWQSGPGPAGNGTVGNGPAGTLTVTEQGPPVADNHGPVSVPRDTPCPPPPGGWVNGVDANSVDLHNYVYRDHPDRFRPFYVTYPNGVQSGPSPPGDVPVVLVVEVVQGDVDQARQELIAHYGGNLCVVAAQPGAASIADQERFVEETRDKLSPLMHDPGAGVYEARYTELRVIVGLLFVSQGLWDRFVEQGLGDAELNPWLRPVA